MSHIYNFFDNHMEAWGAVVFGCLRSPLVLPWQLHSTERCKRARFRGKRYGSTRMNSGITQ